MDQTEPVPENSMIGRRPTIAAPTPIPVRGERQGTRGAGDFAASFTPMTPAFSLGGLAPEVAALLEPQFSALGLNVTALGGNVEDSLDNAVETFESSIQR